MPDPITFTPIGVVHSPFTEPHGTPIQPRAALGVQGTVELLPEYAPGLEGLDGFTHVILLVHLHRAGPYRLRVKPFLEDVVRGLFATRAPSRPNPIGLSIVRLLRVEGATLYIENVDIVDGTPLLDVKPYVPRFDAPPDAGNGWVDSAADDLPDARDDGRFL